MSSSEPADRKSVLYLEQIDIETATRRNIHIKLQLDGKDFEVRQGERPSTWIPSRSLEIIDASKITVVIKARHTMAGVPIRKLEALAEVSVEEAIQAFWNTGDTISASWNADDTISKRATFDQQPLVVTLKLRPSPSLETTRAAVQGLQREMIAYRHFMTDGTEHTGDLVFKSGAILAEINPIVKVAFSVACGVFEVLKEQKKRDEAVADLADCVGRILPYAELVIEDIIYEETELLERVVTKLCYLIRDTAGFVCAYAKQSSTMRTMKSTISTKSYTTIKALTSDFTKLEREFDRAVDVTVLNMTKRNEEFRLLDRLRPADAACYQDGSGCMEGTRTGVLDYLTEWALKPSSQENGSPTANMYWLYGSPGLGKTSIANSLCGRLHESKNLVGSFFCRRDDPNLREPRRVLPTLISKLAGMCGPYRELVAQALNNDPQLNPESKRGETLLSLTQSVGKYPPRILVLVVDALDECGDPGTRKPLLMCLLEACSRVSWIRVIITSRPEHDLKAFFEQNHVGSRDLAEDEETHDVLWRFTRREATPTKAVAEQDVPQRQYEDLEAFIKTREVEQAGREVTQAEEAMAGNKQGFGSVSNRLSLPATRQGTSTNDVTPQLEHARINVLTPKLETGQYIITNVGTKSAMMLSGEGLGCCIIGGFEQGGDTEKWHIRLLSNEQYTIQSLATGSYANCEANPQKGESIMGSAFSRQWKIKAMPNPGRYVIFPANTLCYWSLLDGEEGTQVEFSNQANSPKSQWFFTKLV